MNGHEFFRKKEQFFALCLTLGATIVRSTAEVYLSIEEPEKALKLEDMASEFGLSIVFYPLVKDGNLENIVFAVGRVNQSPFEKRRSEILKGKSREIWIQ